jgi:hypothetical protein
MIDLTLAAGQVKVANEWTSGDLVPDEHTGGYRLPVTPLCLRTNDTRVAIRGTNEEHRQIVRAMAKQVGLVVLEEVVGG